MLANNARNTIEKIRTLYPVGTKVRLVGMIDEKAPPIGTIGEVSHVDDIGTIHVIWKNHARLGLIFGYDRFEKIF